ncbi:hypothetical protein BDW62DRAFT_154924 [Aspergillus aurantiobrunneus]
MLSMCLLVVLGSQVPRAHYCWVSWQSLCFLYVNAPARSMIIAKEGDATPSHLDRFKVPVEKFHLIWLGCVSQLGNPLPDVDGAAAAACKPGPSFTGGKGEAINGLANSAFGSRFSEIERPRHPDGG